MIPPSPFMFRAKLLIVYCVIFNRGEIIRALDQWKKKEKDALIELLSSFILYWYANIYIFILIFLYYSLAYYTEFYLHKSIYIYVGNAI